MSSTKRFHDKVAFVTGAASGIGRTTAVAFASEGARVAIAVLGSRSQRGEHHVGTDRSR